MYFCESIFKGSLSISLNFIRNFVSRNTVSFFEMNKCSDWDIFFFFFQGYFYEKWNFTREGGEERKKKNFILKSEFMFPEESNPFPIVSLFLPRSKLITKGSIKIQIIRKYFWIDILFLFRNQLPLSTVYHYHISPLTILTLPTEEKCSRQTTCFFKDLLKKATTKKTSKRNSPEE